MNPKCKYQKTTIEVFMNIRITGHQISLTAAIKRYVTRKLVRLNKKFNTK